MPAGDDYRGPAMLIERWQTLAAKAAGDSSAVSAAGAALVETLRPLRFQGPDVVNFLQGYLTIDLEGLREGTPRLTALTNLKGRVVATGWCQLRGSDQLDWLIHADLTETVSSFMSRYLAFSKTELIAIEEEVLVIGTLGPQEAPSARLILNEAELDALTATHPPVPAASWMTACIEHGVTLIEPATSEAFLPQMIGLVEAGAVDFDKGCYLGQEVVARAQHRGEVKRRLLELDSVASGDGRMAAGTPLLDENGKEAGSVLMSEPPLCLAVVRQPAASEYRAGAKVLRPAPA